MHFNMGNVSFKLTPLEIAFKFMLKVSQGFEGRVILADVI